MMEKKILTYLCAENMRGILFKTTVSIVISRKTAFIFVLVQVGVCIRSEKAEMALQCLSWSHLVPSCFSPNDACDEIKLTENCQRGIDFYLKLQQ